MSDFDLVDHGEGRYQLSGEMSFLTAQKILRASESLFEDQSNIEVDLAGVKNTDSAGLALLLEWISVARQSGANIQFESIPEKVQAIAQTARVDQFLNGSHSSSSKK